MKVFALVLLAGAVLGGEDWQTMKQWTMMKAYESCFGEENFKLYIVNMKKAIAKCHQQDAPELSLPPYRSTYRFINTMLSSANEMEEKQIHFIVKMMQMMKHHNKDMDQHYDSEEYSFRPYSSNYNKHQGNNWMEKMMKKIVMQKMFENSNYGDDMDSSDVMKYMMFNKMKDSMDFDMMDSMKYDMMDSHADSYNYKNKFGSDYESEKLMDVMEDRMMEERLKESMMSYKRQQMDRINPFGDKNNYRERMSALLRRQRRQASGDSAVTLPGTLDLGDRLADKLKEEQAKMQAKIGNMTCVLRETQVLNSQNELDFTVQKKSMDQFKTSKWFKDRIINNMEMCIKTAEALPYEAQEQYNFQGVVNMAKVKSYMQCMKYAKIKTCMYQDVKNKLEQNFGKLEKILEQTQMTEDQLFPLVMQLLHGEEVEYFAH